MSEKHKPDWTKLGTVEAMAEWIRSHADAICVLVIRPHDSVFLCDPSCAPRDAGELVAEYLPRMLMRAEHERQEKRKGIRLEMEPVPE